MSTLKRNRFLNRNEKIGLPPGTLVAPKHSPKSNTVITLYEYNDSSINEKDILAIEDAQQALNNTNTVKWIDVDGIHNVHDIDHIGKFFKLHPLTMEDIMSSDQRPKFEEYEDYTVATFRMLGYHDSIISEQLTIVLTKNAVLTFQESNAKDAFNTIRDRLKSGKGRVRKLGADYLAYALLDAVVDTYFTILEKIGDKIEYLEEELLVDPNANTLNQIHHLKREMIFLRKAVWPLREMINSIQRSDSTLYSDSTHLYLRDVYDHTVRVIETVEAYRDLLSGMMDIYLSTLSNKTNDVMKVLTVISSIFIPMTFIAGVYGMNFDHMPELHSKIGYPFIWLVMLATGLGMLYYFRRKKWL